MLPAVLSLGIVVPPFALAFWLVWREVRGAINSIDEVEL